MTDAVATLAALPDLADGPWEAVSISPEAPAVASPFAADEAAAAALAAGAVQAAAIWKARTGQDQSISISTREAAASLISFLLMRFDDPVRAPIREPITTAAQTFYRCGDGRWVFLHQSFDNGAGVISALGCEDTREAVTRAVAGWKAQDLEDAFAKAGVCGAMVRTPEDWDACEQGRRLAATPLVEVTRIGDGPPVPFADAPDAPLSGVRVLDLTRVLAGPACARTLAAYGAEVLHITGPTLPFVPPFVADTGHGKRSAHLDLKTGAGRETLTGLLADADVFSQGYRSGAMDRLGLSAAALAAARPGLIHVSINCYGHDGDWATRPGWEQLAQTVSGMAHVQGGDGEPTLLSAALNDYCTGYLAAVGAMVALRRRAVEGGSWAVRVSLTRTAMWVRSLGLDADRPGRTRSLSADEITGWSVRAETGFGPASHLRFPVKMSATQPGWRRPTVPQGTHPAAWG
jgi:crotonobetainyl-CoA:carnitine CoA-transferase CaiB-like acyl-CoA transferase